MAIPTKGSRKIQVDGENYRWLIRRKATYSQTDYGIGTIHVAIDHADDPGTSLIIFTDVPHPKDCRNNEGTKVIPSDVERWIREALQLGWLPSQNGAQFLVKIENGKLKNRRANDL